MSIRFTAEGITLKNKEGETLLISAISNQGEKEAYDNWMDEYESYISPTVGNYMAGNKIVNTFSLHLREFHKQD